MKNDLGFLILMQRGCLRLPQSGGMLQVRWTYGIDYMHNGSIRSYGVIFPEIKEHGYEKSGIPVHEAL